MLKSEKGEETTLDQEQTIDLSEVALDEETQLEEKVQKKETKPVLTIRENFDMWRRPRPWISQSLHW